MNLGKFLISLLISAFLAGCASQGPTRSGVVRDQIDQELRQALAERKVSESTDKALMPPLAVQMPGNGQDSEARFDLSVVSAPAAQVFMAIVTGTRYNMLVGPEVSGQITVNLKDVTVREALESIRELYGYEFQIKGNRISIQPNTLQTRMFQINYLASRRQGTTELRVTSSSVTPAGTGTAGALGTGLGSGVGSSGVIPGAQPINPANPTQGNRGLVGNTTTSRVQTQTDADFWRDLTDAVKTLVRDGEEGRSVVVNALSGVIVVRAFPQELRAVENYLKATQVVVDRQVMLEAKIIEVSLNNSFQAGINWAAFGNNRGAAGGSQASSSAVGSLAPGTTLNTLGQGMVANGNVTAMTGRLGNMVTSENGAGFLGLAFQTTSFAALLSFLESQGDVQVLSSPRIATINNQKALLKVGTDELFVTNVTSNTSTTTTGTISTPNLTLQPYFSGISLDVTPQIDEEDNIILHVHPAVSQVVEKEKVINLGTTLGIYRLPLASSSVNETDSIVRVQDGNIVAIGGLMKQEQSSDRSGLPGTTDSSWGLLAGQRKSTMSKRELVILIKPTIIRDDKTWVRDLEQTNQRLRSYGSQGVGK